MEYHPMVYRGSRLCAINTVVDNSRKYRQVGESNNFEVSGKRTLVCKMYILMHIIYLKLILQGFGVSRFG